MTFFLFSDWFAFLFYPAMTLYTISLKQQEKHYD
jgi:hypothetical protein